MQGHLTILSQVSLVFFINICYIARLSWTKATIKYLTLSKIINRLEKIMKIILNLQVVKEVMQIQPLVWRRYLQYNNGK